MLLLLSTWYVVQDRQTWIHTSPAFYTLHTKWTAFYMLHTRPQTLGTGFSGLTFPSKLFTASSMLSTYTDTISPLTSNSLQISFCNMSKLHNVSTNHTFPCFLICTITGHKTQLRTTLTTRFPRNDKHTNYR